MVGVVISMKFSAREFDLLREAVETAARYEVQQASLASVPGQKTEHRKKEAQYRELLSKLK